MGNLNVLSANSGSPATPWPSSESSSKPNRTVALKTLAVFRLADNWFAVDIRQIERVVPVDYLTRLKPRGGPILGTVGIGSRLVSVVDLRRALGIGQTGLEAHSAILVIQTGGARDRKPADEIGILADEFVDVFFVPADQVQHYPDAGDACIDRIIAGECTCGNRAISVVSIAGVIETLHAPLPRAVAS